MKITQPVDSWKKPSASSGLICERMPVMVTRLPLAMIAIGTVATNNAHANPRLLFEKVAVDEREERERE